MASAREKAMLGAFALFIVLGGGGYFVVLPGIQNLQQQYEKSQNLEAEIKQLDAQSSQIQSDISRLEREIGLPKDLAVRTYTPDTLEQNIKGLMDTIIGLATYHGSDLISLKPIGTSIQQTGEPATSSDDSAPAADGSTATDGGKTAKAPPPDKNTPATASDAANASPDGNGEGKADSKPANTVNLMVHSFDLSIRGRYQSILSFLEEMRAFRELVEIETIALENEAGPARTEANATQSHVNPLKPIKLTARMKLYLLPADQFAGTLGSPPATPAATANDVPPS
ncbi:MAG: hypothetical protein SFZ03_03600 [Candidatus Melainabacteria bacterium]|nr:hypothetical protein [Candidatus Melainabacteria bacterium]